MTPALASSDLGATVSPHPAPHRTVLLNEAVDGLSIRPDGLYVDATFGRGGHSRLILQQLGPQGRLIAFDRDPEAVKSAQAIHDPRFQIIHAPFSELTARLAQMGVTQIDGLLLDLGVSSPQIDNAARGFSFQADGPLDMRMDPTHGVPVSVWISQASTADISKVIADYGEERFAVPIADAITARCQAAQQGEAEPLASTRALAELVVDTLRRCRARREPGHHPATRTFQALRIHINHEVEELTAVLQAAIGLLRESGRLAVISFHSLEDRVVKQFIRDHSGKTEAHPQPGLSRGQHALIQAMSDLAASAAPPTTVARELKPIARLRPSRQEVLDNPRARSATLRIAERCAPVQRFAR
jgi:16S rRNA (cytosine1402-N4)-methyltransferase